VLRKRREGVVLILFQGLASTLGGALT